MPATELLSSGVANEADENEAELPSHSRRQPASSAPKSFFEAAAAPMACPSAQPARPSAQEPRFERQVKSCRPCAVAAQATPAAAGIMLCVATTQRAAAVACGKSAPASMQQPRPPRRAAGGQERGDMLPRC